MAEQTAEYQGSSRARLVLGTILVLLVLLLVAMGVFFARLLTPTTSGAAAGAEDGGMEWIRSMYGFGPSTDEQLLDPTSVAFAPDGRIYATDPQRARIMIFNPDGSFNALLHTGAGGTGRAQFVRPEGVDVDEDGLVYVADSFANKIIVFDADNRFVREWAAGKDERTVGVWATDSAVYVLGIGKLTKYDKQGNKLGEFGSRGRRPGQIDAYQGVTTDGKRIYIADAMNQRVAAFAEDGQVLWTNPAKMRSGSMTTAADAPYDLPQDLVLDANGRLVTIDAFKFEIIVSDPKSGKVLKHYGVDGAQEGQFFYPTSIDYDPARDWFAVADTRNNRVQIVRLPDTGGGALQTLQRTLVSPYRYCAIPLALLLLAAIVAAVIWRRRSGEWDEEDDDDEDLTEPTGSVPAAGESLA